MLHIIATFFLPVWVQAPSPQLCWTYCHWPLSRVRVSWLAGTSFTPLQLAYYLSQVPPPAGLERSGTAAKEEARFVSIFGPVVCLLRFVREWAPLFVCSNVWICFIIQAGPTDAAYNVAQFDWNNFGPLFYGHSTEKCHCDNVLQRVVSCLKLTPRNLERNWRYCLFKVRFVQSGCWTLTLLLKCSKQPKI